MSGEDGSLARNNDIVVDTEAPYVEAVFSLREGTCTLGEVVDLQVRADPEPGVQREDSPPHGGRVRGRPRGSEQLADGQQWAAFVTSLRWRPDAGPAPSLGVPRRLG